MKQFKLFETWENRIGKGSVEDTLSTNRTYDRPTDYKSGSKKIGNLDNLEIHHVEHPEGGSSHFTWNPEDKRIHHIINTVNTSKTPEGNTRHKFVTDQKRKGSLPMGKLYTSLIKNHKAEFVGTSHSPGAKKMWDKFHDDHEIEVLGHHPSTGETKVLSRSDPKYAPANAKSTEEKKIGSMNLIVRKKSISEESKKMKSSILERIEVILEAKTPQSWVATREKVIQNVKDAKKKDPGTIKIHNAMVKHNDELLDIENDGNNPDHVRELARHHRLKHLPGIAAFRKKHGLEEPE
jgi:hypothetical protein